MSLSNLILFIDAEAVVIDKPAGLPVDTPRRGGDSIVSRLDELRAGFKRPPTPMHRLDQDTSGCLLFARSPRARVVFQQAFEARAVEKYYLAVVSDEIAEETGTIDLPLAKKSSAEAGWRMVADPAGQSAVTHWRRLAVRDGRSLIEFRPETGRTHQIRVHLAHIGHSVIGDPVYGTRVRRAIASLGPAGAEVAAFSRQALHARLLGFTHPATGEALRFESALPEDMARLISSLELL